MEDQRVERPDRGSAREIFLVFLRLGLTSFGGPIAHLGYFRTELVENRKWLSDAAYADLVALCQFLPGPASSQTGFALGLIRGGWAGALAAWIGFTTPSAIAMILFAYGAAGLDGGIGAGVIAGLKGLAVAIVAHAVLGMGRNLCQGATRLSIMLAAMVLLGLWASPIAQLLAIALGGALGLALISDGEESAGEAPPFRPAGALRQSTGIALIAAAGAILVATPLLVGLGIGGHAMALFDAFYRAGALVFGGGHVVLPLLEGSVVGAGWVSAQAFLAGYGAVQAVPGPIFTFAAYLGAANSLPPSGVWGAMIALVGIFLPGCLLVAGTLPLWDRLRRWERARAILAGVNAAVVGVLAQALYDPVFLSGILSPLDFAVASGAFLALTAYRAPVWWVVVGMIVIGGVRGAIGL
ncbi:MAG: chromate efflux transporter [Pseudomonadota bacterium]